MSVVSSGKVVVVKSKGPALRYFNRFLFICDHCCYTEKETGVGTFFHQLIVHEVMHFSHLCDKSVAISVQEKTFK